MRRLMAVTTTCTGSATTAPASTQATNEAAIEATGLARYCPKCGCVTPDRDHCQWCWPRPQI
jgi:hypothetical protein